MKISSAEFIKSATNPKNYPPPELAEVAFAGRSNVGKSSLINVLVNRKNLVRTSATGQLCKPGYFLMFRLATSPTPSEGHPR